MKDRPCVIPTLASLYSHRQMQVQLSSDSLAVVLEDEVLLEATLHTGNRPHTLECTAQTITASAAREAVLALCEGAFIHHPHLQELIIRASSSSIPDTLVADGLLRQHRQDVFVCRASALWQTAAPWLPKASFNAPPLEYVLTDSKRHPLRPAPRSNVLYRRFIPWLGQTLTFEIADPDRDLADFHRWMNTPRVAEFWEEQGSREAHHGYLQKLLADPHAHPLIGRFDGRAFGYFEVYWAKEDRIAPFYDAHDYDRGVHLLVGEEAFRGKAFYTAWFSSMCHYLFVDEPRTQRIVCEPRHDNQRQIANFSRSGFASIKHFDFPHKRALLVMLSRERFFSDRLYQPLDMPPDQESTI